MAIYLNFIVDFRNLLYIFEPMKTTLTHTFTLEGDNFNYEVEVRLICEYENGTAYSMFGGGTPDFEDRQWTILSIHQIDENGNKERISELPSDLAGELETEVNEMDIDYYE